ncbi:MAG: glucose 1-dehydrogenase [Rudaea sp.]|uniref:glucose 1-dehydrogenase n=1 Tax=unclassified Rudaea TaxID=2627037 RepID=UPI0010F8D241|nr:MULTISPECIES: glucose 1-dehydrogenase [unclassified Rudaea]MBN8887108.1 glucose 1-dehydrogenase [Rudaea sp.]
MARLDNKIALVSGGARGLGAATCHAFVREGARVAIADIDLAAAQKLAGEIGASAKAYALDVTDEGAWDRVVAQVVADFGGLTTLVNNAGIGHLASVEDCTFEQWRAVLAVNLDGVFLGTRAGIRAMKSRGGGSIINISSVYGIVGSELTAAYNASKGGVRNFTKSAALHCAKSGYEIRINSVHPSFILTDMVTGAAGKLADPQAFLTALIERHPLGRLCEPADVAHACVYLASDETRNQTGIELVVDAGYIAQ